MVTVTNNNRRDERRREEKHKKQALERRQSLGLMAPREEAPGAEHIAYASIGTENEHIVSWLFKQSVDDSDFFGATKSPYTMAISMLKTRTLLATNPPSTTLLLSYKAGDLGEPPSPPTVHLALPPTVHLALPPQLLGPQPGLSG
jgi:hypothetical protein